MKLDKWQQEVLKTKGNLLLCSGRQTGKSFVISRKAGKSVIQNKGFSVLIVAPTERQSEELLIKCLTYIEDKAEHLICKGRDRPTKHIIKLTNSSVIRCLPTGAAGKGIRGFSINLLIADEAAFMEPAVWSAITPMLLTTAGMVWLVSTPKGKQGYFYDRYNDKDFKTFHVNSEKVMMERETCDTWTLKQREGAVKWLKAEKDRMSDKEYRQEYLGEFVDDLTRFFSDNLIKTACVLERLPLSHRSRKYLGVNISEMGLNEATYQTVTKHNKTTIKQVDSLVETKILSNNIINKTLELDRVHHYSTIYMDDSGAGSGVFGNLLMQNQVKRKIIPINKSKRSLDLEDKWKTKLTKEDLYNNMLVLLEQKQLQLLDDDEVKLSLQSIQYEYVNGDLRVFGQHNQISEGLIRACWCSQDKRNTLWCR